MAAGRGEFFRSLLEGLDRRPALPHAVRRRPGGGREAPCPGPGRGGGREAPCPGPGRGRGQPVPNERHPDGRKKRRPKVAPTSASRNEHRCPKPTARKKSAHFPELSLSQENFMEKLPSEVLIKILSYLDASSLFCISHVSKVLHQLSNDDIMWQKIYMSEFGNQMWTPKLDGAVVKEDLQKVEDRSLGHWKKMYLRSVTGQGMNIWRRELRHISPYTGLPRQTEWVLRHMNVSWELTVCDRRGWETTLEQSRAFFFESSVIVRWNGGSFLNYYHISNIQLHGVRKDSLRSSRVKKPGWRSLILKLNLKTQPGQFIGKDRLIRLIHLPPSVIIGIWRGHGSVAFIMVCLHFHQLVEKSVLGSLVCPYSESVDRPPVDTSDPEFGLHGYTLHFILHNTSTEIMSGSFHELSCHPSQIQRGLVELRVINRTDLSQHRSLSGNVKLSWKREELEGSVENCCIMTLTLLDDFQKPFWCVSSPVSITVAKKLLSSDYSGKHFLMEYHNPEGQVKMKLVWLNDQKQFFLISLTLYISVSKINKHFSREY